jgi:hypothetical protein
MTSHKLHFGTAEARCPDTDQSLERTHMVVRPRDFSLLFDSCSFAKFAAEFFSICVYLRNLRLKFQSPFQVFNQIIRMFQANRQAK